ncbi:MAG: tetratricopeptide repeat protein [Balneolaceae bacterium]|nr:tetratricopeptide repeat protein [Balneolaceae bacterium]
MALTYRYVLIFILILFPAKLVSQSAPDSVDELLRKASRQADEMNETGALKTYMEILERDSDHYKALWNASLLHSVIGHRLDNKNDQQNYFEKATELAEKAVEHYPDRVHPYYVLAVAKGRISDIVGTRTRIKLSHEIEDNVQKALDRNPNHAPSWHLYGVLQSEVANLSRVSRFASRFISDGLPEASNQKAEEYLKRALKLNPKSILFYYDLAKHYIRSGQEKRAIPVLEKLLTLEPTIKDNKRHINEARELLDELKKNE